MHNFLLVFLMTHFLGDFVFQTNKIALQKSKGIRGLTFHCAVIIVTQVVFMSLFGLNGILAAVISGLLHFSIDILKNKLNKYFKHIQSLYFILDQALHIFVILAVSKLFATESTIGIKVAFYSKYVTCLIIATYITSVFAKILVRDVYPEYAKEAFFRPFERPVDALFGVSAFAFFMPSQFLMMPLVLVPSIVYVIAEERIWLYSRKVVGLKLVSILGFAWVGAYLTTVL